MAVCAQCKRDFEGPGKMKSLEMSSKVYCSQDCLEGVSKTSEKCDTCKGHIGMFDAVHTKGKRFCSESCAKKGKSRFPIVLGGWFAIIAFTCGVFFLFGRCGLMVSEQLTSHPAQRAEQDVPAKSSRREWNEGGTLHRSDDSEWLAASYENRLATAADYVATLRTFSNMAQMRRAAERMEHCITRAAATKAGQKSSALAAVCNELLK